MNVQEPNNDDFIEGVNTPNKNETDTKYIMEPS